MKNAIRTMTSPLVVLLLGAIAAQAQTPSSRTPSPVATTGTVAPVSTDYRLVAGDKLRIEVYKDDKLSQSLQVRPDGKITLPLIDDIRAVGLKPSELKEILMEKWKAYITAPEVSVIVTQVNSLKVYMVGEIPKPGVLVLKGPTRLLQAISQAGGFTQFADRSRIIVLRTGPDGGESRLEFNYKKIISGDRPGENIFLKPGDTVIVP